MQGKPPNLVEARIKSKKTSMILNKLLSEDAYLTSNKITCEECEYLIVRTWNEEYLCPYAYDEQNISGNCVVDKDINIILSKIALVNKKKRKTKKRKKKNKPLG